MKRALLAVAILILSSAAQAQVLTQQPFVRASGSATVSVKPDQLKLSFSVITQAATAQAASDQNATQMDAVLLSLRKVLGPAGEIKTVGYSVSPVYKYSSADGTSTLIGYRASNTVEAATDDLSLGGKLIDAATAAGASAVQGLRFGLKDPEPVRGEALRKATLQARTHAEAIAAGLGMQLGSVVSAEESSAVRSIVYTDAKLADGARGTTPVESGLVEVSASVVVEAQLK